MTWPATCSLWRPILRSARSSARAPSKTQVSRLLSHPVAEVRDLGVKLREAATGPAWNVNAQAAAAFAEKVAAADPALAAEAAQLLTREVRTAPTLVKYAQPNDYEIQTSAELCSGRR